MIRNFLYLISFTLILNGCSAIKTYPDNWAKNIFIISDTKSDSVMSSVKASIDIFDVNNKCREKYIGTVQLKNKKSKIGLKNNQIIYLDFHFLTSGFFASSSSVSGLGTLIKTRNGYIYEVMASYKGNIYDVSIWEKRTKGAKGRELEFIPLHQCQRL